MRRKGVSPFQFEGTSIEIESTAWSEFANGIKATVKQMLGLEEINTSKKTGMWDSHSGIRVKTLTIWVRLFKIETLWQSLPGLSVPPEQINQFLWRTLKSLKTSIFADGLIERALSLLDEIASKTVHKEEDGDW